MAEVEAVDNKEKCQKWLPKPGGLLVRGLARSLHLYVPDWCASLRPPPVVI